MEDGAVEPSFEIERPMSVSGGKQVNGKNSTSIKYESMEWHRRKMMLGRKEEAEVIIRLDQQDGKAHVCVVAWPAMLRRMTKLHGESLDGADPQHSARWIVPIQAIRIRSGKKRVGRAPLAAFVAARARQTGQFDRVNLGNGLPGHESPQIPTNTAENAPQETEVRQ